MLLILYSKPEVSSDQTAKPVRVTVDVERIGTFVGSGKNSRLARINAASKALKQIKK